MRAMIRHCNTLQPGQCQTRFASLHINFHFPSLLISGARILR